MNILTFDIEEWYIHSRRGGSSFESFDRYLESILDLLARQNIRATFFCVGEMGRLFPEVVRLIHDNGHEIGCHSNVHAWLNKMSRTECEEDTRIAIDSLEQCIGVKVKSYRAPAFSIGENNKWAFEVLVGNGIERDASVFPIRRDFGGFSSFGLEEPCIVEYQGSRLKEFPVCTTTFLGRKTVCTGGGYFRFFPLWFIKRFVADSQFVMCYFHILDLNPESSRIMSRKEYEAYFNEPGTLKARYIRYMKSNIGKKGCFNKMVRLVSSDVFLSLQQAEPVIDWGTAPKIKL